MAYDKLVPFSFQKEGIYYFERRVPQDLKGHYLSSKISYSLRTRSATVAASRAKRAAQQLDEYWYHLRVQSSGLPGRHRLRLQQSVPSARPFGAFSTPAEDQSVRLSEAVAIYLQLKGADRSGNFQRTTERACGYVIDICGDKNLLEFTKSDATRFRDALIEKQLAGSSISRIFGVVRSVINTAASETGVSMTNPFCGVYFDRQKGVKDRGSLPISALKLIQRECRATDDDLRWLVALVSDTGLRLAEAAGLLCSDLVLDTGAPHVVVRSHPWRRLKTASSERRVPLVGASLWAASRVVAGSSGSDFAFPRYNRGAHTQANSASAALNKWLSPLVPEDCSMHSFRHALRDRLRAVECPSEIIDQIGGWRTAGVGASYGKGYPLSVLAKWMTRIQLSAQLQT